MHSLLLCSRLRRARVLIAATLLCLPAAAQQQAEPAAAAPKPPPDVIVFTNGDRLTGAFERGVGDSVVFKSDMAGEITVPLAKIKELRSSGKFAILRKDVPVSRHPAPVASGTVAFADKQFTVQTPPGPPTTIPTGEIGYIVGQATYEQEVSHNSSPIHGWNGAINGGATLVRATDYGETYTAGIGLIRAIPAVPYLAPRNRTSFNLQETYGKLTSPVIPPTTQPSAPSVTVTSIFHADAERDEYFSTRFYALAQTSFDHNYAQGLDLQEVYGAGIGWTVLKDAKQQFDLKATIQYEKQTFQTASSNQNLIGSTLAETYHRSLPRKLLFTESASALPAWNDTNAYSFNASAVLAIPVLKRLSLTLTTTDNFLNDPSAGYQKNSFQFVTAASYTLK